MFSLILQTLKLHIFWQQATYWQEILALLEGKSKSGLPSFQNLAYLFQKFSFVIQHELLYVFSIDHREYAHILFFIFWTTDDIKKNVVEVVCFLHEVVLARVDTEGNLKSFLIL